jgi:cell division protein FtsI/penicillin-binding protein 2
MRSWMVALAAVGVAAGLAPFAKSDSRHAPPPPGAAPVALEPAMALSSSRGPTTGHEAGPTVDLNGLDLTRIGLGDDGATAPLDHNRVARLTVDPTLQAAAQAAMAARHIPEASVVLMDPASGEILVYASHVEAGPTRDLPAEARAPAASVFKIVTASALVDDAGLGPDTRQCYSGGEEKILASDLVDNPTRDRWCVTLGGAMGRSVNAVFARLASKHLAPESLERAAGHFGFGQPVAFDVSVEPSTLRIPEGTLGFARTAAGFWNTTLSPVHAAWISAALQRGGDPVRPYIVRQVAARDGTTTDVGPRPSSHTTVVSGSTAAALTTMMEHTVSEGTSFRAFHDARRAPFLPGIIVAGKTGTLTDDHAQRYYTWFTGFAPSRPVQGIRPVAVAVLVVNGPSWRVKANVLAREVLQSYFAEQKAPQVVRPRIAATRTDESD